MSQNVKILKQNVSKVSLAINKNDNDNTSLPSWTYSKSEMLFYITQSINTLTEYGRKNHVIIIFTDAEKAFDKI